MKKDSMGGMVLSLSSITVIVGVILAVVNHFTEDAIADAALQTKIDALAEILPELDNNPLVESRILEVEGENYSLYPAMRDGDSVGMAVECKAHDGFSGDISLMFGFDNQGKVVGFRVLEHNETPGLGAKMNDWFRDSTGHRSVIGLDTGVVDIRVAKDGGEVDGITAATITSRAFIGALNRAAEVYRKSNEGNR